MLGGILWQYGRVINVGLTGNRPAEPYTIWPFDYKALLWGDSKVHDDPLQSTYPHRGTFVWSRIDSISVFVVVYKEYRWPGLFCGYILEIVDWQRSAKTYGCYDNHRSILLPGNVSLTVIHCDGHLYPYTDSCSWGACYFLLLQLLQQLSTLRIIVNGDNIYLVL